MSTYTINIDDEAVTEQIRDILNQIISRELRTQLNVSNGVVAGAVKEIVYSRKDEIINKVVERATREIVKKGLPTFLLRLEESHSE